MYGTAKPRDDVSLDEDRMSFGPTTSSFIGLTSQGSERVTQMPYTSETYRKETPHITDSMFASLCTVEARSRFYNWLHHDFGVADQYIMEREFEVLLAYFTNLPFHRIRLIMDCFGMRRVEFDFPHFEVIVLTTYYGWCMYMQCIYIYHIIRVQMRQ
jgi:hypothetical protein